jgi:hypothetical protein
VSAMRLEDLTPDTTVRGILPDVVVKEVKKRESPTRGCMPLIVGSRSCPSGRNLGASQLNLSQKTPAFRSPYPLRRLQPFFLKIGLTMFSLSEHRL